MIHIIVYVLILIISVIIIYPYRKSILHYIEHYYEGDEPSSVNEASNTQDGVQSKPQQLEGEKSQDQQSQQQQSPSSSTPQQSPQSQQQSPQSQQQSPQQPASSSTPQQQQPSSSTPQYQQSQQQQQQPSSSSPQYQQSPQQPQSSPPQQEQSPSSAQPQGQSPQPSTPDQEPQPRPQQSQEQSQSPSQSPDSNALGILSKVFLPRTEADTVITDKTNVILNPIVSSINNVVDVINYIPQKIYDDCMSFSKKAGLSIKKYAEGSKYYKDDKTNNVVISKGNYNLINNIAHQNPRAFLLMRVYAARMYKAEIEDHEALFMNFFKEYSNFKPSMLKYAAPTK
jgi:hypothetical protein